MERITQVAAELFAERGYAGTTVAQIADAADVSRALLFFHFGSKEGLLDAVLDRARTELNAVFEEADGPTGLAAMRSFLEARTKFFIERPQAARLAMVLGSEAMSTAQHAAIFLEFQQKRVKLFERCISEAIAEGSLRSDVDGAELAHLLVAATDGDQRMWALDPEDRHVADTDRAILNLLELLRP